MQGDNIPRWCKPSLYQRLHEVSNVAQPTHDSNVYLESLEVAACHHQRYEVNRDFLGDDSYFRAATS